MELKGRIFVALDPEPGVSLDYWISLASRICSWVAGFKVGLPFVLAYGVSGLKALRGSCEGMVIADFKLADVEHVMVATVSHIAGYVDGVIAHAFTGAQGALEGLKRYLDGLGLKLVLVASMSHPGSLEVIDVNLDRILWVASRVKPWGLVAPATRPQVISYIKSKAPWAKILAPGVGPQGAKPGEALKAGADYEIVGRLITRAPDPVKALEDIMKYYTL